VLYCHRHSPLDDMLIVSVQMDVKVVKEDSNVGIRTDYSMGLKGLVHLNLL